jgi:hypothetical protein
MMLNFMCFWYSVNAGTEQIKRREAKLTTTAADVDREVREARVWAGECRGGDGTSLRTAARGEKVRGGRSTATAGLCGETAQV